MNNLLHLIPRIRVLTILVQAWGNQRILYLTWEVLSYLAILLGYITECADHKLKPNLPRGRAKHQRDYLTIHLISEWQVSCQHRVNNNFELAYQVGGTLLNIPVNPH